MSKKEPRFHKENLWFVFHKTFLAKICAFFKISITITIPELLVGNFRELILVIDSRKYSSKQSRESSGSGNVRVKIFGNRVGRTLEKLVSGGKFSGSGIPGHITSTCAGIWFNSRLLMDRVNLAALQMGKIKVTYLAFTFEKL